MISILSIKHTLMVSTLSLGLVMGGVAVVSATTSATHANTSQTVPAHVTTTPVAPVAVPETHVTTKPVTPVAVPETHVTTKPVTPVAAPKAHVTETHVTPVQHSESHHESGHER